MDFKDDATLNSNFQSQKKANKVGFGERERKKKMKRRKKVKMKMLDGKKSNRKK